MPAQSEDAELAIVEAFRNNDAGLVARLLDSHPSFRSRLNDPLPGASFGATPLLCAVQKRSRELIDVLLAAGADINGRSHWWAGGFGVLDNDHGMADFLIERGATVNAYAAARLGRLDRLAEIVAANPAAVHDRGGDGQTPLHVACSVEIAGFLLGHGADIDALDVDHESTPAQYLVRAHPDVARFLVSRGCRTDILLASAVGDVEGVRRFLDANPASLRCAVTPEFFPMKNPRAGGTIYIWTLGQNQTAHGVARTFESHEVLRLLMERTPPGMRLALAGEWADTDDFHSLLANHPGLVESLGPEDRNRLAYAAQSNNADAVSLMLDAGWPTDVRSQHGATPLHWAAFHGATGMLVRILRCKPALEARDADYDGTPLNWAIYGSENGWHSSTGDYPATVEALLAVGAAPPSQLGGTEAVKGVLRKHGVTS